MIFELKRFAALALLLASGTVFAAGACCVGLECCDAVMDCCE